MQKASCYQSSALRVDDKNLSEHGFAYLYTVGNSYGLWLFRFPPTENLIFITENISCATPRGDAVLFVIGNDT